MWAPEDQRLIFFQPKIHNLDQFETNSRYSVHVVKWMIEWMIFNFLIALFTLLLGYKTWFSKDID